MSAFKAKLAALGHDGYAAYLAGGHWRAFKQRYRDSDRPKRCAVCRAKRVQPHHHTYHRLGAERLDDVTPLCREHHIAVHDWLKTSGKVFVEFTHEAVAHFILTAPADPAVAAIGKQALELAERCKPLKQNKKRKQIHAAIAAGDVAALRGYVGAFGGMKQRKPKPVPDRPPTERPKPHQVNPPQPGPQAIAAAVAKLSDYPLTPNQRAAADRFAASANLSGLRSLLTTVKNAAKKRAAKSGTGHTQSHKDARKMEHNRWSDPLAAIRMLANGSQVPTRLKGGGPP